MITYTYTYTEEETRRIGAIMAKYLDKGDIILLSGDLGAGKTQLTKGLGAGLNVAKTITSPTFTLMKEYQGKLNLYHFDLYRIEDPEEIIEVGLLDYMYDEGVTVIEWFEKMDEEPSGYIKIDIYVETDKRRLEFFAKGDRYDNILRKMKPKICPE